MPDAVIKSPRPIRTVPVNDAAVILRDDERLEYHHERYANQPHRPRGVTVASTPQSFVDLVRRLNPTVQMPVPLYVTDDGGIDAVMNDDISTSALGAWRDWRIAYRPTPSDSWKAWNGINGKPMNQLAAAEFIQERIADFVKPVGAEMLELAQRFEVARSGRFVSSQRLADGNTDLIIEEQNKPRTTVKVPEVVKLAMRVFEGMEAFKFDAYFRWKVTKDDELLFTFKLTNRDDVLRAAVDGIRDAVRKGLPNHASYSVKEMPATVSAFEPRPVAVR